MKIIYRTTLVIFCLIFAMSAYAQKASVIVEMKLDSMQLLIGQQTRLTLDVTCDATKSPVFPDLKKGSLLVPGVEVVNVSSVDTTFLNDKKRMMITQSYIITSFDSSYYYIPPMEVMVDTSHYRAEKALALCVYTVPIDTLHLDAFLHISNDTTAELVTGRLALKPIQEVPFSWQDWKSVVYNSLIISVLLLLIFAMVVWLKQGNPVIRIVRRIVKLPAHTVAMTEIQRIKNERNWTQDESKEYYTQLTDTLRNYIQERYGFRAMDMTSTEIIERLMQENDEVALNELRHLFQTADLVKFAKYSVPINENDSNLLVAINYINVTKQEVDTTKKDEAPEYTPDEIKNIRMKLTLRILIPLFSLVALAVIALVCVRLYDILS